MEPDGDDGEEPDWGSEPDRGPESEEAAERRPRTPTPAPAPGVPTALGPQGAPAWDGDWGWWYENCNEFGPPWSLTKSGNVWPEGFQVGENGRLFHDGKMCVPTGVTNVVLQKHHNAVGHLGGERLIAELDRWFEFGDPPAVKKVAGEIIKRCGVCQAAEHPHHSLKAPLRPTPIPPRLMDSVALDVFNMEPTRFNGVEYNCLVLCVDRQSGWIVASPQQRKGLTAKKVALDMLDRAWGPFGVPSIVTSDRGPQFAGAWWTTMCAGLGIRVAHAHAYHHQGNGRAEAAGRQLRALLRKMDGEERGGINWVEALPRALRFIHDRRGEAGLSPYEIMFGRLRPLQGIGYESAREAQDAVDFLEKMREIDGLVARRLNALHARDSETVNKNRRPHEPFLPGEKVWYLRPRGPVTGEKMASWWLGPCPVISRVGDSSYVVEVKPGVNTTAHVSQLKLYLEEVTGESMPLHFFKRGSGELELAPDEWVVDKIIGHRLIKGKFQFLTQWEGYDKSEATWEPVDHFIHRYSTDLPKYCKRHNLPINIIEYLSSEP